MDRARPIRVLHYGRSRHVYRVLFWIDVPGHWLAFVSRESGRDEVYVQPYPGPGAVIATVLNAHGSCGDRVTHKYGKV